MVRAREIAQLTPLEMGSTVVAVALVEQAELSLAVVVRSTAVVAALEVILLRGRQFRAVNGERIL